MYLIERLWTDPMENRNAHGYKMEGYISSVSDAERYCKNQGTLTQESCWSFRSDMPVCIMTKLPNLVTK